MAENKEWQETEIGKISADWIMSPLLSKLYIKGRIGWKGLKKEEYLKNSEYIIINGTNIKDDKVDWNNCGFITEKRYLQSPEIMLRENDIIMTKDGTIGKVAIVSSLPKRSSVASGIFVIRPEENSIHTYYLYSYFRSRYFKELVKSRTEGSVIPHLYQRDFGKICIPLPPSFLEQAKIAAILKSLDDKIELNNKMNETLEEMAQTMFKEWFVNFNFPNEEGKPYKDNGGKMVESELGMIPEGWREYTLRDFIKFIKGKKPQNINGEKTDRKEQYLTIKSYTGSEMLYADIDKTILINEGDLAMVMDGASSGSIFYGKPGIVASTMAKIENKTLSNDFLYFLIKYYEKEIKQHLTGSAIPHVDKEFIFNLRIAIPLNNLNYSIFSNIRNKIINIMNANQTLIKTRYILLPKLMSGEIRVK